MTHGLGSRNRSNAVQRALAHPVRAQVYAELKKGPASPSQLAETVGESVGVASYHVRVLSEAGLAHLVETVPKRGALQHFYAALDHEGVGVTFNLPVERASRLQSEVRALVEAARAQAGDTADGAEIVVVVHVGGTSAG